MARFYPGCARTLVVGMRYSATAAVHLSLILAATADNALLLGDGFSSRQTTPLALCATGPL